MLILPEVFVIHSFCNPECQRYTLGGVRLERREDGRMLIVTTWREDPPLLFETLIFDGKHDGLYERYATWDEAKEGYRRMCRVAFEYPVLRWIKTLLGLR